MLEAQIQWERLHRSIPHQLLQMAVGAMPQQFILQILQERHIVMVEERKQIHLLLTHLRDLILFS